MRAFKQACLTMVLLFIALIALNTTRLGRAPAQVGPPAIRNGDVDCDGQINITDPLVLLNWLFSDGPAPCAIAQTEPCCTELQEEVAMLRATVDALSARVPSPKDIVLIETPISGTQPIFTVPGDKWLVVTSLLWSGSNNEALLRKIVNGVSTNIPRGQEIFNNQGISLSWLTGAAFPPGSRVDVVTSIESPIPFRLNGYLVGE